MTSVTFPDGTKFSDDGSSSNDMRNGGFRSNFLPMVGKTIGVSAEAVTAADAAQQAAEATAADAVSTAADRVAAETARVGSETAQNAAASYAVQAQQWIGTATNVIAAALSKQVLATTTLVDCFVYDTRTDTDGGAWIDRCGWTSWENETLNTATRGPRRKFPVVALIVAEQAKVTVYDALDLDASGAPRLWMAFTQYGYLVGTSGRTVSSVFAINGRLYIAQSSASGGLCVVDFAADRGEYRTNSSNTVAPGPISARNVSVASNQAIAGSAGLVSRDCNAVAARVLPGAPLDAAGLAVPTIAVATAGGVSVIKHDGNVWDITRVGGYARCAFLDDTRIAANWALSDTNWEEGPIPSADVSNTAWRYFRSAAGGTGTIPSLSPLNGGISSFVAARGVLCMGHSQGTQPGLTMFAEDTSNPANGMVAYLTATYATGWMPGDTRGAWLCDGTTGAITGSTELVSNGGFDTDTAWTKGTGWTISGGVATKTPGAAGYLSQSIPTVAGQTYLIQVTVSGVTAGNLAVEHVAVASIGNILSNGTYTFQYTAPGAPTSIGFSSSSTFNGSIDNVSVRLATPDRSYKAKGLVVNGTLTRAAANGGDVVVWSGFTPGNCLTQPYNPDFDFTADFVIPVWFSGTGAAERILERAYWTGSAYSGAALRIRTNAGALVLETTPDGFSTQASVTTTATFNDGNRHLGLFIRRGATLEIQVDGVVVASATAAVHNLTNTSASLYVGNRADLQVGWSGTLAMLRTGAYAPSAAQIAKMYADERQLFDAGAKAFLGGVSNAVSSLTYDDSTGKLAVGTGDGVSVFAGLRRVGYTDAAGVAVGSNLVTNGDFSSGNTTGWTAVNSATLSVVSGRLRVTRQTVDAFAAQQTITGLVVGKTYLMTATASKGTNAEAVVQLGTAYQSVTATGDVSTAITFTATATSAVVTVRGGVGTAGQYAEFDDIVVKELGAISTDTIKAVSMRNDALLIGTSAEVGVVAPQVNGREAIVAPRGQAVAVQPVAASSGGNFDFAMLMAIGGGVNIPYLGK